MATTSTSASTSAPAATGTTTGTSKKKKKSSRKSKKASLHTAFIIAGTAAGILCIALAVYLFFERHTPRDEKVYVILWSVALSFLVALLLSAFFVGRAMGDGKIEKEELAQIAGWIMVPFSIIGSLLLISAIASHEVFHFMLRYLQTLSVYIFAAALLVGITGYLMTRKKDDGKGMSTGWKIALTVLVLFFLISVGARLNRAADRLLVKTYAPQKGQGSVPAPAQSPTPATEVKKVTVDVDVNVHKKETVTKTIKVVEEPATLKVPPMDWSDFQQKQEEEAAKKPKGHLY
jgi:nitrate reductase gamma subunit